MRMALWLCQVDSIQVVTRWGGDIKKLGFGHSSWRGEKDLKGKKEGDGTGVCSAGAGK